MAYFREHLAELRQGATPGTSNNEWARIEYKLDVILDALEELLTGEVLEAQSGSSNDGIQAVLAGQAQILERLKSMATAAEVQAALDAETAALATVASDVAALGTDLTRIATDIEALKTAGGATPAQLDTLLAGINANAATAQTAATAITTSQTNIDAVDPAAITPTPAPPAP